MQPHRLHQPIADTAREVRDWARVFNPSISDDTLLLSIYRGLIDAGVGLRLVICSAQMVHDGVPGVEMAMGDLLGFKGVLFDCQGLVSREMLQKRVEQVVEPISWSEEHEVRPNVQSAAGRPSLGVVSPMVVAKTLERFHVHYALVQAGELQDATPRVSRRAPRKRL